MYDDSHDAGSDDNSLCSKCKNRFSDPSATVGGKIKVNMKITSSSNLANADVMLAYDSSALEFVSGTNADGGAGAVRVHGDGGTPGLWCQDWCGKRVTSFGKTPSVGLAVP